MTTGCYHVARWCRHRWHRTWPPVSWPAVLSYRLGKRVTPMTPKQNANGCQRKLSSLNTEIGGCVWLQNPWDSTSMFKIVRDLQTFPGFLVILPPQNRDRWHPTRDKKNTPLTWQHPHLALQQWSRAGCWQRRARFANLPRCRWPPGIAKKWKTVENSSSKSKLSQTLSKSRWALWLPKIPQVQWGMLCKNGRFVAWPRRKRIANLPKRSPCSVFCLIAARFLLEQQQLWESDLFFAREQGYNMVSQRGLNNYMRPCLLGYSTRRVKVLRGVLGAHLLNLTHWKVRASVVMI